MRVFISSTLKDLADHRTAVADMLARASFSFLGMENMGSRPVDPTNACLQDIDACDIFVGLYAHRYGHIPEGETRSITEIEPIRPGFTPMD